MSPRKASPLPLGDEALVSLSTLRGELAAARARIAELEPIVAAAACLWGQQECAEGQCDCAEYIDPETGEPRPGLTRCPNVEERHATATDIVVRADLEYLVEQLLDMLGADRPPDWADLRDEIETVVLRADEHLDDDDPRGEKPRPDLYRRVRDAYLDDCRASATATGVEPPRAGGST